MYRIKFHLPLVLLLAIIFVMSSLPSNTFPKLDFELSDKIVHFIIYFLLFCCFYYSLNNQNKFSPFRNYSLYFSLFFTALYGATDELHQYFVPNRSCDFYDWLADSSGAIIALLFIILISKIHKLTKQNRILADDTSE
jgi:VanZ family protein